MWSALRSHPESALRRSTGATLSQPWGKGPIFPPELTWPPHPAFHPYLVWDHIPRDLHAVLRGGPTCTDTPSCPWLGSVSKAKFLSPRGCPLPPLSLPSAERMGVEEAGMYAHMHSWGRLRAPPGAFPTHPSRNIPGMGSLQPLPSQKPAAQPQPVGFLRGHLKCPLLVPHSLERAGPQERTSPSWPHTP